LKDQLIVKDSFFSYTLSDGHILSLSLPCHGSPKKEISDIFIENYKVHE
jgi:hypothetical protein